MKLLQIFSLIMTVVALLNEETKEQIRTTFEVMNEASKQKCQGSSQEIYCSKFTNLIKEQYFYKKEGGLLTLAIAAPENEKGKVLALFMIADVSSLYDRYGFLCASIMLQYSLWMFFTMEIPQDGKVAALYATQEKNSLEIINTGLLWAGLYRQGIEINTTQPFADQKIIHLLPGEYFQGLDDQGMFRVHDYRSIWEVQNGDVLVVTWANLPSEFPEIVQLAVETVEKSQAPLSLIISNLKAYFNMGNDAKKVFAAIRLT